MLEKERKLLIGSPSAEGCWKLQCMNIANKLIQFTLERFVFTWSNRVVPVSICNIKVIWRSKPSMHHSDRKRKRIHNNVSSKKCGQAKAVFYNNVENFDDIKLKEQWTNKTNMFNFNRTKHNESACFNHAIFNKWINVIVFLWSSYLLGNFILIYVSHVKKR